MIHYEYFPDVQDPDPKRQENKKTYVCNNCHTVIMDTKPPSSNTQCLSPQILHKWYSWGLYGKNPKRWVCRICSLHIISSIIPNSGVGGTCEGGKTHQFMQM